MREGATNCENRQPRRLPSGRSRRRSAGLKAAAWCSSTPREPTLLDDHHPPFTLWPRTAGSLPRRKARVETRSRLHRFRLVATAITTVTVVNRNTHIAVAVTATGSTSAAIGVTDIDSASNGEQARCHHPGQQPSPEHRAVSTMGLIRRSALRLQIHTGYICNERARSSAPGTA